VPVTSSYVDSRGQRVQNTRCVKATLKTNYQALTAARMPEELSAAIIAGDPELHLEQFGRFVSSNSRIYLNRETDELAYGVVVRELVYGLDGSLKQERAPKQSARNVVLAKPRKWSGRMIPKQKAQSHFGFAHIMELSHIDGLTYDFLYGMARELEERDSFMLLVHLTNLEPLGSSDQCR